MNTRRAGMNVIVFLGSRNRHGQTARATEALAKGVQQAGGKCESVFLTEWNVERCRQCEDHGWGTCRTEGKCVIEDHFAELAGKLKKADAAVFATPVYYSDLSESLRAFLDRLRRTCTHETGRAEIEGKPAVGVGVAGGGGGGAPASMVSLEKVLQTCGMNVVDTIAVRRQNLEMKRSVLEHTGQWLAKGAPE